MRERTKLALILVVFAACWFLPVEDVRFLPPLHESLALVRWYAHEHVLLCLVPAFFIAGAINEFVSQGAVMKYLGARASKFVTLAGTVLKWFEKDEMVDWVDSSWMFAKQILPLLLAGVAVAGLLLGGPHSEGGLIPKEWIERMVGGSSLGANLFASVSGAFMYFATLTEVPILEGLLSSGMGKGPALALLLSGPAVSLPNVLVIRSVIGTKKTAVYILLVVLLSTGAGWIYGAMF